MSNQNKDDEQRPFHYEGDTPIFDGPSKREDSERDAEKKEEREYKKEQIAIQRGTLYTQIGLVVFGVIGAAIGGYQAHTSRVSADAAAQASRTASETLTEMRTGSGATDTHTLAQQAVTQATQTGNLATASKKQADQTERLANDAVIQAKAANLLAVQAQRSADYAKQSIDTAVDAERPWIGVNSMNNEDFVEGKTGKISVYYINSGKRPATATIRHSLVLLSKLPVFPDLAMSPGQGSVAFMLPGSTTNSSDTFDIPEGAFRSWKREHQTLYVIIEIVYTDVGTSTGHITHYCSSFDPDNKQMPFPLCPRFNEAR